MLINFEILKKDASFLYRINCNFYTFRRFRRDPPNLRLEDLCFRALYKIIQNNNNENKNKPTNHKEQKKARTTDIILNRFVRGHFSIIN